MNYLDEFKLKKEKKEALSNLVGKKAIVLCGKQFLSSLSIHINGYYSFDLKEITIKSIDNYCNIIGFSNDKTEFIISENIVDDVLILNLERLRDILESLFIKKEYINLAHVPVKDGEWVYNLSSTEKINLDKLMISTRFGYTHESETSMIDLIPAFKTDVNSEKPLLLCFNTNVQTICLEETKVSAKGLCVGYLKIESEESFKNGFYYGLEDIANIVEDICNYHQEYFIEKNILKKCLEKILSF